MAGSAHTSGQRLKHRCLRAVLRLLDLSAGGASPSLRGTTRYLASLIDQGRYGELDALLDHVSANKDVWIGWTYWAGGPWWGSDYEFSIEPADPGAPSDRPQMAVLREHLP